MKQKNKCKMVGEYKYFTSCRFCGDNNMQMVIDLGLMPLAGGFIKNLKQINQEKFYPLQLNFCRDCFLLQTNSSINPDVLFKNYFYFSSSIKTLVSHFENIAKNLRKTLSRPDKKFIVEIGANDGVFVKKLIKQGFKALGVDPARNVVKIATKNSLPIISSYFTERLAEKIVNKYGKADAIYSFHSMAHIEDMHDVMRGVKKLLKIDGFLAMEVHYLGDLLNEFQYDMIYHEHQFYYSLLSLKKFLNQYNMDVFNIKRFSIRGGSIMFFVQNKKGGKKINKSVKDLLVEEKMQKLDKVNAYINFSKKIVQRKKQLTELLAKLKKKNKKIIGYGASGRGTVMMNYCNLSKQLLDYVVDDAPAKWGMYMPGTHQEIKNPKILSGKKSPDYAVLFAWPFLKEVKARNKNFRGKFIIPLPKVKIV